MDNGGCASRGWSVIESAPTNSQLAGLLTGFVFSGIVVLFVRRGSRDTQALGLFSAAFVVLGFDSYVFSVLAGTAHNPNCAKVWSAALVAGGMLGVGAVAVVGGICWLLAAHTHDVSPEGTEAPFQVANLDRLARIMVHGMNFTVALLVARTSRDYLNVAYQRAEPAWLSLSVLAVPATVGLVALGLTARRSRVGFRSAPLARRLPRRNSVFVAQFGTLAFGVTAPVFASFDLVLPDRWSQQPSWMLVAFTLSGGLLIPGALLVALVIAIPPLVTFHPLDHAPPASARSSDGSAGRPAGDEAGASPEFDRLMDLIDECNLNGGAERAARTP